MFIKNLNAWSRALSLASCLIVFSVASLPVASAQTKGTPFSLFQYSTLAGAGNTVTATRVLVVTAAGNVIFKDITIQFNVDDDGNLTLSADYPQIYDSQNLLVSSFKAGSYVGPGSVLKGKTPVFVDGPGASNGGATSWSFSTAADADICTYPNSATWYVGPIEDNPLAARLTKAGIKSTAWSYGVASGPENGRVKCTATDAYFYSYNWEPGTLIGVSQSGNAITIASFTDNGFDKSAPVDQITYRAVPPQLP